ncbi:MAG: hypothetical protein ACKN9A_17095, partial [Microcystis aeruginosa]
PSNSDDFDGIIDKDGTTYQALKCNLLEHMKLQATQATADNCTNLGFSVKVAKTTAPSPSPSPSRSPSPSPTEEKATRKAVPEFNKPQKTNFSLNKLVEELDKAFFVSSSSSYKIINVRDPNNEFGLSFYNMTEPADKEAWIKAILQYQHSLKSRVKNGQYITIPVNGVINYKNNTYNLLKCDVAAKLGKELSNKPEICGRVKPID